MALREPLDRQLDNPPLERHDPEARRRLSGPAMRTFLSVCTAWNLSVNQQRGLLGWPAPSTYHKYYAAPGMRDLR
jgi:hypothetical protein